MLAQKKQYCLQSKVELRDSQGFIKAGTSAKPTGRRVCEYLHYMDKIAVLSNN